MQDKILIVGDTIVDRNCYLDAIGLSLESPTLKTSFIKEEVVFGGAANVARYCSYFGSDVVFYTSMSDESAELFREQNKKIVLVNVDKIDNTKTRFYVKRGDNQYKYLQVNNVNRNDLDSSFDIDLTNYEKIAISDYRCGLITDKIIEKIKDSNTKTFAASQVSDLGSNIEKYTDIDILICNEKEAEFSRRKKGVIVTLGKNGCKLNGQYFRGIEVPETNIITTIGAGDCFYAAYLHSNSLEFANKKAAEYIQGKI